MANPKCPNCESLYTDYVTTEKSLQETKKIYYCNNCKKKFNVSETRKVAEGDYIFKF